MGLFLPYSPSLPSGSPVAPQPEIGSVCLSRVSFGWPLSPRSWFLGAFSSPWCSLRVFPLSMLKSRNSAVNDLNLTRTFPVRQSIQASMRYRESKVEVSSLMFRTHTSHMTCLQERVTAAPNKSTILSRETKTLFHYVCCYARAAHARNRSEFFLSGYFCLIVDQTCSDDSTFSREPIKDSSKILFLNEINAT